MNLSSLLATIDELQRTRNTLLEAMRDPDDDSPLEPEPRRSTPDDLGALERLSGGVLPPALKTFVRSTAVNSPNGGVTLSLGESQVYFEGCLGIEQSIEDNTNLANARQEYDFFADAPPCFVVSLLSNTFLAVRLDDLGMIHIDGDDGEVTPLDVSFEGFVEAWVPALREAVDGLRP